MKPAPVSILMWAIICVGPRRDGLVNCTIRRTRREAWQAYGAIWNDPADAIRRGKRDGHTYARKVRVALCP